MIISFALTEQELLTGKKTVTRRRWKPVTAAKFKAGTIHQAWSNLPYVTGARKLGTIKASADAYQERLADISAADLLAEGGMCASTEEFCQLFGGDPDEIIWVARFEFFLLKKLLDWAHRAELGLCRQPETTGEWERCTA